jgi:hypothetical protein
MEISYDELYLFLALKQKEVYEDYGITPWWMNKDLYEVQKEVFKYTIKEMYPDSQIPSQEELDEYIESEFEKCPSPYQNPILYSTIIKYSQKLISSAERMDLKINHPIIFGTIPTGIINGVAYRPTEKKGSIILLEEGVWGFANLTSKIIAKVYPMEITGEEGVTFFPNLHLVEKNLNDNPIIYDRFLDLIYSYIVLGDPHKAEQYFIESPQREFASFFCEQMEMFILGHEIAHVVLGHLDKNEINSTKIGKNKTNTKHIDWAQETQADLYSIEFIINILEEEQSNSTYFFFGADLFFNCIEVIENAVRILKSGNDEMISINSKHPPTIVRWGILKQSFIETVSDDFVDSFKELSDSVRYIFQLLWENSRPRLIELYNKGERPLYDWKV